MKDKDGIKLANPERTCKECAYYPCFEGIGKCKCDLAKYGCKDYRTKKINIVNVLLIISRLRVTPLRLTLEEEK